MVDHSLYSGMDTAREGADRQQTGKQNGRAQTGVKGDWEGGLTGWHTVDR